MQCPECRASQTPLAALRVLLLSALGRSAPCEKCAKPVKGPRANALWVLLAAPVTLIQVIAYLYDDSLLRPHATLWMVVGIASIVVALAAYVTFSSRLRVS